MTNWPNTYSGGIVDHRIMIMRLMRQTEQCLLQPSQLIVTSTC